MGHVGRSPSALGRLAAAVLAALSAVAVVVGAPPAGAAPSARIWLVRQTSWVSPGETLTLALRAADVVDPAALELAVTVHPAVRTRADLTRSLRGEGLTAPLTRSAGAVVPLPEVPVSVDGTLTVQVATQAPGAAPDPARVRLRGPGIYPLQVELRELGGGETHDRFTTHLLAVTPPADGSRLGAAVVLPLSAPPSSDLDGLPTGPPAGASALADTAAGLGAAPRIPVTLAPTPEVLEALDGSDATTAVALKDALAVRSVLARPYVPVDVQALGAAAAPLLPRQLAAGREAVTALLGEEPIGGIWLGDEPLDGPGLAQVVAAGAARLVLPQAAVSPSSATAPLVPITLTPPDGPPATALVADEGLAARLNRSTGPLDQPLVAHHLLADLAAIATLPADQGDPVTNGRLAGKVATVLAGRDFTPTSTFLTELLGGLASSPVLEGVELAAAFARPAEVSPPAPPAASTTRGRRGTTTTAARVTGRTLAPVPPAGDRSIGDVANDAIWQLASQGQVLADPTPLEATDPGVSPDGPQRDPDQPRAAELNRRLLVATSADLPVDQQRARLRALAQIAKADLDALKMPEGRSLRLTARSGQLPVGIFNDTGRKARVLLQLDSEKLEFPAGNRVAVVLDHRTTTELIRVRVRASGSFPVQVRMLTPDGSRVLQETEYTVRANTLPGVAFAVSGAAAIFLARWWIKTLLPKPRHLRRRRDRRRARAAGG